MVIKSTEQAAQKMTTLHLEIQKQHPELGDVGTLVSFCMNNSFYLIMHFQKSGSLIRTVSGCLQVWVRPFSACILWDAPFEEFDSKVL